MNSYPEENLPDDNRCQTIKHFPESQSRAPAAHRRQSIPACGPQADCCPVGMTSSISSPGLLTARYSDLGKSLTCPRAAWLLGKGTAPEPAVPVENILKQAGHEVKFSFFHVWFLLEPWWEGSPQNRDTAISAITEEKNNGCVGRTWPQEREQWMCGEDNNECVTLPQLCSQWDLSQGLFG